MAAPGSHRRGGVSQHPGTLVRGWRTGSSQAVVPTPLTAHTNFVHGNACKAEFQISLLAHIWDLIGIKPPHSKQLGEYHSEGSNVSLTRLCRSKSRTSNSHLRENGIETENRVPA